MPDFVGNSAQREAIMFADGAMQVLAGPGSGKTFVTIQRIKYLIEVCGVEPASILVITFTKAAANEMKERFYSLMKGKMLPVNFGTFHAVFYHILKQTGQYHNFSLITEMEKRKLILQILRMPSSLLLTGDEKVDSLIRYISQIKNSGDKIETCYDNNNSEDNILKEIVSQGIFSKKDLLRYYHEYNQYLMEFHKLDFDDMGLLCEKVFSENPLVVAKWQYAYRYILVDEFQDINDVQYRIVKEIAGKNPNLFIVGDDDQSIYGFRGARPDIMKKFMLDYPHAKQLLLDTNYRCHEQIVQDSLQVISVNENRFEKKIKAVHREGNGVEIQTFSDREKEYEWLLAQLKEQSNTAIIYRTNYECNLLAEKLLLKGIPFQMKEQMRSQFDHFVIKDLMAYLEFANGNRSRELFHLIMNRPLRYLKKDSARAKQIRLQELLAFYKDNKRMQNVAYELFEDIEYICGKKPYLAIQYIRNVIGYDDFLIETYGIEAGKKLIQIAEDFQQLSKEYRTYKELTDYVSRCKELVYQKQKEQEADKQQKHNLHIMTMHMAKGLEFDTVYLPDLNEGKIPMRQARLPRELEEERRMLYVAMTRARKSLYLMFCKQKTGKDVPSRFLTPILSKQNNGE